MSFEYLTDAFLLNCTPVLRPNSLSDANPSPFADKLRTVHYDATAIKIKIKSKKKARPTKRWMEVVEEE